MKIFTLISLLIFASCSRAITPDMLSRVGDIKTSAKIGEESDEMLTSGVEETESAEMSTGDSDQGIIASTEAREEFIDITINYRMFSHEIEDYEKAWMYAEPRLPLSFHCPNLKIGDIIPEEYRHYRPLPPEEFLDEVSYHPWVSNGSTLHSYNYFHGWTLSPYLWHGQESFRDPIDFDTYRIRKEDLTFPDPKHPEHAELNLYTYYEHCCTARRIRLVGVPEEEERTWYLPGGIRDAYKNHLPDFFKKDWEVGEGEKFLGWAVLKDEAQIPEEDAPVPSVAWIINVDDYIVDGNTNILLDGNIRIAPVIQRPVTIVIDLDGEGTEWDLMCRRAGRKDRIEVPWIEFNTFTNTMFSDVINSYEFNSGVPADLCGRHFLGHYKLPDGSTRTATGMWYIPDNANTPEGQNGINSLYRRADRYSYWEMNTEGKYVVKCAWGLKPGLKPNV